MSAHTKPDSLSQDFVKKFRSTTFRSEPHLRLKNKFEAIQFVNSRGYTFFWPITRITFASLWVAVAGDRPVPNQHDDPAHITWRWKDELLGSKKWYYAKVLRKKATIISNQTLPYFYALSNNYGSPEEDHLILYEQGLLTIEEKLLYEALLREGPLDTIALKRVAHLSSPQNESRFDRALANLQSDFKILPIGIAEVGSWRYAFIYEITARYIPELIENAHLIDEITARTFILRQYFNTIGAATIEDIYKLFHWKKTEILLSIQLLMKQQLIIELEQLEGNSSPWYCLKTLLTS